MMPACTLSVNEYLLCILAVLLYLQNPLCPLSYPRIGDESYFQIASMPLSPDRNKENNADGHSNASKPPTAAPHVCDALGGESKCVETRSSPIQSLALYMYDQIKSQCFRAREHRNARIQRIIDSYLVKCTRSRIRQIGVLS